MLFRSTEFQSHIHSLQAVKESSTIPPNHLSVFGKASFCTLLKQGSLTVECALVLLLFFMGVLTMISYMDIYRVQTVRQSQLREKAEKMGVLCASWESAPEEINLPDFYTWEPPVSFFPLLPVRITSQLSVHTWTGYSGDGQDQEQTEEMVYIAQTGSVYHQSPSCSYLELSVESVSQGELDRRRNESGGKYYPCERCMEKGNASSSVYITGSGNRYHSQMTCSGLKRTVRMVEKSKLRGWRVCSRCG